MAARQRRKTQEEPKQEEAEEKSTEEIEKGGGNGVFGRISRRNLQSLLIGLVGASITLGAYSQTIVSSTQCIGIGLFVLFFGLLVSEGLISL